MISLGLVCLNAVAESLFEDGQRPVEYYLAEAAEYIRNGMPDVARDALCDALRHAEGRQRSLILHACKAVKKVPFTYGTGPQDV